METPDWRDVYDFWFPSELVEGSFEFHKRIGEWWMRGGATPELPPFLRLIEVAATGGLDHWSSGGMGRLSLIVLLDQFPRGLFAGTPRAYAFDLHALRLCEEGLTNGHYRELAYPWERFFFTLPLLHAEGPDHVDRLLRLLDYAENSTPGAIQAFPALKPIFEFSTSQLHANLEVISQFGRFPHRNHILGRPSTPGEVDYIDRGDFVHLRRLPELVETEQPGRIGKRH